MLPTVITEYISVRNPEYLQRSSYRGNAVIAGYSVRMRWLDVEEADQFRDRRGRSRQCYMVRN